MTPTTRFQQDTIVTIKGGKSSGAVKFESHRYWEIVGELSWRGADRNQATDNAKWCGRAEPGSEKSILIAGCSPISLKVRTKA